MTFLFGRGTPQEKFKFILTATKNHSLNLMKFASLYKSLMIVMRRTNSGKERSLDSFVAGVVGGWIVFGERTTVNEQVRGPYMRGEERTRTIRRSDSILAPISSLQIVLYSCARCVSALLPRSQVPSSYPPNRPIPTDSKSFEIFAALVWGSVMYLFENKRIRLQNGLVNSMDYLYVNAEHWDGLRNLFWHNK